MHDATQRAARAHARARLFACMDNSCGAVTYVRVHMYHHNTPYVCALSETYVRVHVGSTPRARAGLHQISMSIQDDVRYNPIVILCLPVVRAILNGQTRVGGGVACHVITCVCVCV